MAKKMKELEFSVKNKVGGLAGITEALKAARVNIVHMTAWVKGGRGYFLMVTDNNAQAKKALGKIGIRTGECDVLEVRLQNRVGALDRIARKCARAKMDLTGLSATSGGKRVSVLLYAKNINRLKQIV